MKKRLKVIVPIFLAVCFVAVWGFRFHTVNAETKPTPVKVYKMGEPAPYEKDFFHFADEGLEGYVLTVKSAKLMTYKEFVELHGQTEDFIPKNEIRPTYVYDVEVYIQNHKTEDEMKARLTEMGISAEQIEVLKTAKSTYELKLLLTSNNEAVKEMITNLEDLSKLMDTLTAKLEEVKEMKTKVEYLNASLNEVSIGLTKLSEASSQINAGIKNLNDGAIKVSDGTQALNAQGIKTLVNYTNKIVTFGNKLENLVNLSKSYKGYTSNNADNTLFVYKLSK